VRRRCSRDDNSNSAAAEKIRTVRRERVCYICVAAALHHEHGGPTDRPPLSTFRPNQTHKVVRAHAHVLRVCDKHLPITKNSSGLFYTGLNSAPVEGPVCVCVCVVRRGHFVVGQHSRVCKPLAAGEEQMLFRP
jgi:hypothetical protein